MSDEKVTRGVEAARDVYVYCEVCGYSWAGGLHECGGWHFRHENARRNVLSDG